MSSFHRPLPPAAHKPRAPRHCETASLSAWTRRRNLSNSQHVRENLNLTWVWRNLKSFPFSSSFTSKSTTDKGQPGKRNDRFLFLFFLTWSRSFKRACSFPLTQTMLRVGHSFMQKDCIYVTQLRRKGKWGVNKPKKKKFFFLFYSNHIVVLGF